MTKIHFRPYNPNQTVLFPQRIDPIMDAMWDWGEVYKKKLAQEEDAAANA